MECLQYRSLTFEQKRLYKVLNLVINGMPSIR